MEPIDLSPKEKQHSEKIQNLGILINDYLNGALSNGTSYGFGIIVFPVGDHSADGVRVDYTSNIALYKMLGALKTFVAEAEASFGISQQVQ
jgi:hypothetical protein